MSILPRKQQVLLKEYEILNQQIRHYDTIVWAKSGVLLPLCLYTYTLAAGRSINTILLLSIGGLFLCIFWFLTYDRLGKEQHIFKKRVVAIEEALGMNSFLFHGKEANKRTSSIKEFHGFGDFVTFWFLRLLFVIAYVLGWVVILARADIPFFELLNNSWLVVVCVVVLLGALYLLFYFNNKYMETTVKKACEQDSEEINEISNFFRIYQLLSATVLIIAGTIVIFFISRLTHLR